MHRYGDGCGVFGVYGHPNAAEVTFLGLYALQHRGQESAGIVSSDGRKIWAHKGLGLVSEVFGNAQIMQGLKGSLAIGHNRYSTTGSSSLVNAQPLLVNCRGFSLAIAHNGNLVNASWLRHELQGSGAIFQTTSDTEVIAHLIARSRMRRTVDQVIDALTQVRGAYSLLVGTRDAVLAVRDPRGFRPLCLGWLEGAWIAASESCALDIVGAEYVRDIEPGEVALLDARGLTSLKPFTRVESALCVFEYIYLCRPDSRIFGDYVDKTRRRLGHQLALEHPAEADCVISVPDSSNTAALGYSETSGIPFEIGLIRSHYVGRTFIEPSQAIRDLKVRIKFNPVGGVLEDRRIVVVEDSIVRGTTMRHLARMIRAAGASEIHVRVSCPPLRFPCYYGMDFPTPDELAAAKRTIEGIRQQIGVETLGYLSLEGMQEVVPNRAGNYCAACFDGDYPLAVEDSGAKERLEQA